jgi:hypothetical protein
MGKLAWIDKVRSVYQSQSESILTRKHFFRTKFANNDFFCHTAQNKPNIWIENLNSVRMQNMLRLQIAKIEC